MEIIKEKMTREIIYMMKLQTNLFVMIVERRIMELTKHQKEEIARLYKSGYTRKGISERLNIPLEVVVYNIRKMRKDGIKIERWWKE